MILRYVKNTSSNFTLGFSNFFNFVKGFLTSYFWPYLDKANKRVFVFNSKFKSLYSVYNTSKFFSSIVLKQSFIKSFFFSCTEMRDFSAIYLKQFLNVSKLNHNFFFIFRFLPKVRVKIK